MPLYRKRPRGVGAPGTTAQREGTPMDTTESSAPAQANRKTNATLKLSARLQRGIALAEERFEEITRTAPYIWTVPSCTGEHTYTVDLKAKICSCPDRPPAPEK